MELFAMTVSPSDTQQVKKITVRVVLSDYTGTFNITDIMLQGGVTATRWASHPAEMKFSSDDI